MGSYRTFKSPYVQIEDCSGRMQPIFKEYAKRTPEINYTSEIASCPFLPTRKAVTQSQKAKKVKSKVKCCEVCCVKYTDYEEHCRTSKHVLYAIDNTNYAEIDTLIKTMPGSTFSQIPESPCKSLETIFSTLSLSQSKPKPNKTITQRVKDERKTIFRKNAKREQESAKRTKITTKGEKPADIDIEDTIVIVETQTNQ